MLLLIIESEQSKRLNRTSKLKIKPTLETCHNRKIITWWRVTAKNSSKRIFKTLSTLKWDHERILINRRQIITGEIKSFRRKTESTQHIIINAEKRNQKKETYRLNLVWPK